jgi:hypothetical protein
MKTFCTLLCGCLMLLASAASALPGGGDPAPATHRRYVYLQASAQQLEGNFHIYSKIFEVEGSSEQELERKIHDLLLAFEDRLNEEFPSMHFMASLDWVAGAFAERPQAEARRQATMVMYGATAIEMSMSKLPSNY